MMTNPSDSRSQGLPTLMLVAVTALWGLSFPQMKTILEAFADCPGGHSVKGFTLIAVRMLLGLAILAVVQPQLFGQPNRRERQVGGLIGIIFFLGFTLQVVALAWITPAQSAFITSLASAWVPLLAWVWWRLAPARLTLVGLVLGVAGVVLLGIKDAQGVSWGPGEGLTVLASVLFAVELLMLDRLGRTVRSAYLTAPFFGTIALLAVLGWVVAAARGPGLHVCLSWAAAKLSEESVAWSLGALTVFSTVLAFHWMNVYQPRVGANRAALIYLLEPVFGTVISIAWGHDLLTWELAAGGSLILGGNFLVELPAWLASGRRAPDGLEGG